MKTPRMARESPDFSRGENQPNEKVRIRLDLTQLSISTWTHGGYVLQNEQFKIIIKPPYGSVLDIVRTAPAQITAVNDLS